MKYFDAYTNWLLDTKSGLVFGCLLMLGTAGILGSKLWHSPKTATISETEWACTDTEPKGISAVCINYRKVR